MYRKTLAANITPEICLQHHAEPVLSKTERALSYPESESCGMWPPEREGPVFLRPGKLTFIV